MKYFIVFLISHFTILAQGISIKEPEFVGNVVYVDVNQSIESEKQKVFSKTSASTGLILFGIGNVSSSLIIKGKKSPTRIKNGKNIQFLVRVLDNNFDAFDKVEIVKLRSDGDQRKLKVASSSYYESNVAGSIIRVKFQAKKYGISSYLIEIPNISQGEYAFNVNISKENQSTGNTSTFYLFGIDSNFQMGQIIEWEGFSPGRWIGEIIDIKDDHISVKTTHNGKESVKTFSTEGVDIFYSSDNKIPMPKKPIIPSKETFVEIFKKKQLVYNINDIVYWDFRSKQGVIIGFDLTNDLKKAIVLTSKKGLGVYEDIEINDLTKKQL